MAGEPDAKRLSGQAGPWGRFVGLPARPQVFSPLASEDAASCSDSSSLVGLELVGDWVSGAVNGAGLQARPAHRGRGSQGAAEHRAGPGWRRGRRGSERSCRRAGRARSTRTLALRGSPARSLPRGARTQCGRRSGAPSASPAILGWPPWVGRWGPGCGVRRLPTRLKTLAASGETAAPDH